MYSARPAVPQAHSPPGNSESRVYPPSSLMDAKMPSKAIILSTTYGDDDEFKAREGEEIDVEAQHHYPRSKNCSSPTQTYDVHFTPPGLQVAHGGKRKDPPPPIAVFHGAASLSTPVTPVTATTFSFDFDDLAYPTSLPTQPLHSSLMRRSSSFSSSKGGRVRRTPIFAPVTRVESPLIMRAQWDIMYRSMWWGLGIALLLEVIFLVLPARGKIWGTGWR